MAPTARSSSPMVVFRTASRSMSEPAMSTGPTWAPVPARNRWLRIERAELDGQESRSSASGQYVRAGKYVKGEQHDRSTSGEFEIETQIPPQSCGWPTVCSRGEWRSYSLDEPGRLRPQGYRHRLSSSRWYRGRCPRRPNLLDQHGLQSQRKRWLHRACRYRRKESQGHRSAGQYVHAEADPAR